MRPELPFDDALCRKLPLPLAQHYRRAHNAKSAQERYHAGYYLWEASLKLLAATAVVSYFHAGGTPTGRLAEALQNFARPSVWCSWAVGSVTLLFVLLIRRLRRLTQIKDRHVLNLR